MRHRLVLAAACALLPLAAQAAAADQAPATTPQAAAAATPDKPAPPRKATPQERAMADRLEPLARAAFWSHEVDTDPTDTVAGVRLASALRALGHDQTAIEAAARVLVVDPANYDALMETARAYVAENQGFYAIDPAQKAHAGAPRDWRSLSVLGVAYEQVERDADAQATWRQALALSPDNPAVLANMAMSLAARGQADQAEILLRKAIVQPGATLQERQDLTLVLGAEGKLGEAETLLRQDLPPEQADADLAYLQALAAGRAGVQPAVAPAPVVDPHSWAAVKAAGG